MIPREDINAWQDFMDRMREVGATHGFSQYMDEKGPVYKIHINYQNEPLMFEGRNLSGLIDFVYRKMGI